MKHVFLKSAAVIALMGMAACSNEPAADETNMGETTDVTTTSSTTKTTTVYNIDPNVTYRDLNRGEDVNLQRDEQNGYVMNMKTSQPVEFYVDMNTRDTFYGKTGMLVNGALLRTDRGYELDDAKIEWEGDEMKIKGDDIKIKAEGDEYKYKDDAADVKIKSDGDEYKYKSDNIKIKKDGDETKIKTDDVKIKKEGDEVKVKRDD